MPPQPKTDRRVTRTRNALHDAFRALIQEKGYDTITVEEITQRAGLGRATFYLHYRDKEDLLLEEFSELARDRVKLMADFPLESWISADNPPFMPLLTVFQNAAENAELYRVVLNGEGAARITARLRDIIIEALASLLLAQEEGSPSIFASNASFELLAYYMAGALSATLLWWLEQPGPLEPEAMTVTFQHLFFPGAAYVFGNVGG